MEGKVTLKEVGGGMRSRFAWFRRGTSGGHLLAQLAHCQVEFLLLTAPLVGVLGPPLIYEIRFVLIVE